MTFGEMMLDRTIVCDKPIVDSIFDLLKMHPLARTRGRGDWGKRARAFRYAHNTHQPSDASSCSRSNIERMRYKLLFLAFTSDLRSLAHQSLSNRSST
jgi:hypothetical protein